MNSGPTPDFSIILITEGHNLNMAPARPNKVKSEHHSWRLQLKKIKFPRMVEILPEVEGNRFAIRHFEISNNNLRFALLRDAIYGKCENTGLETGKYVKLIDKETGQTLMVDTWNEFVTNVDFINRAHGDVLIGGLGIGLVILPIQDKKEVKSITVVEKHREVIDLVLPQLPVNSKVKVIHADVFEWVAEQRYNVIYFDIWDNVRGEYYKETKTLYKKYRKFLKHDDPRSWIGFWRQEDFKRALKKVRMKKNPGIILLDSPISLKHYFIKSSY